MSNSATFHYLIPSYKKFEVNADNVFVVEFYRRDTASEPTVSIINAVSDVFAAFDDEPYISIRFVGGTDLTFTGESYFTNLSGDAVVFSSKHDDETYCIIEDRKSVV